MSSEPKRNFVLVQMDSIIFKYDLITKELLFRWKTQDNSEIILFDKDDKLCTVSKSSVRLWDFEDGIEQPPSIWATEEFGKNQQVDKVYINEGSNAKKLSTSKSLAKDTDWSDDTFILVVFGNTFRIYHNRLTRTNVEMTLPDEKVTSACFSETNDILFLGMSNGNMRFVNLLECVEVEDEQEAKEVQVELREPFQVNLDSTKPITKLQRFTNQEHDQVILVTQADERCDIF